jgi:hypothetical protein
MIVRKGPHEGRQYFGRVRAVNIQRLPHHFQFGVFHPNALSTSKARKIEIGRSPITSLDASRRLPDHPYLCQTGRGRAKEKIDASTAFW